MKNQPSTYSRTRTDWSSEIKPADTRTLSETPRAAPGGGSNSPTRTGGSSMDTMWAASNTGRGGMDTMGAVPDTGRGGMNTTRAASDTGRANMDTTRAASDTGRGGINADEWLPDEETLVLPDDRSPVPMGPRTVDSQDMGEIWPNIENNLSNEVIESPTTMEEVYRGSMKSLLLRNVGNYVVATFLIGTQTTVSWEGILYDVGNDYLAIYQSGRDQYIVSDLYSLKYVEFYDTRRRELCDSLLTAQEPNGNFQRQ